MIEDKKINEVFQLNGRKLQVVEQWDDCFVSRCDSCYLQNVCHNQNIPELIGHCSSQKRKDQTDVIFTKVPLDDNEVLFIKLADKYDVIFPFDKVNKIYNKQKKEAIKILLLTVFMIKNYLMAFIITLILDIMVFINLNIPIIKCIGFVLFLIIVGGLFEFLIWGFHYLFIGNILKDTILINKKFLDDTI